MNVLQLDLPTVVPSEPKSRTANPAGCCHSSAQEEIRRVYGHNPEAAAERLQELEEEWSIEGLFEGSAAIVGLTTLVLGLAVDDRWLALPLLVSALLLWQTIQGWCPLLPFMRGMGFRTEREIQFERHVLQLLDEEHIAAAALGAVATAAPRLEGHHALGAPAGTHAFSLRDFLLTGAQ